MGPQNVGGFHKVDELATYLVSLSTSGSALTNEQAARIVELWKNLEAYDQRPTSFSPRHRTKATGRFKSPKKRHNIVVPGAESTKR